MPSQPAKRAPRAVLGVTGGIAAYKSAELVRLFRKAGWEVRVVMTKQAEAFVGAVTFESLSGNPVLRSLGDAGGYDLSATSHIDLAQWGDILVVAPATANFLAKHAAGICDDALTTEALSFTGAKLIAPAMNTRMWQAAATRENCERLRSRGVEFVGPADGDLACGETGVGKMSEPAEIFAAAQKILGPATSATASRHQTDTDTASAAPKTSLPLAGLSVLVTSGPTRSYIDSVRFITNRSSGKMGHAIATIAENLGAKVTLVTGPVDPRFAHLSRGRVIAVETNREMLAAASEALASSDMIFATAAVADFEVPESRTEKIERKGELSLALAASPDILATLSQARRRGQVFVGFAAETGDPERQEEKARAKLVRKGVDFVALNDVGRKDIGFDVDENEMNVFERVGDTTRKIFLPRASKAEIARELLMLAAARWKAEQALSRPEARA